MKEKIVYATSNFIFFVPLLFTSLSKRKKYANQGLLILLSWFVCYLFSLFLASFSSNFINIIMNIITYTYPLILAIIGAYNVYKEKEWNVPFFKNLKLIKH